MMNLEIDQARPVREGEQLDVDRLWGYLKEHFPDVTGPLLVGQFPHGHSNLTYLLHAGDREMVLRRPPFGNVVKSAHDMGREYRVLSRLCRVYPPAPCPLLYCEDESVIGAPFYLMERRRGVILRRPTSPDNAPPPETARRLGEALIDNLALLHSLDYQAAGLGDLGKPEGYVARQVAGWTTRYRDAQTDAIPALDQVAAWLDANQPKGSGAALIHNDYKFDNLVLDPDDPTRIVAVLDWEMATVGDPLMDLGTSLGYWVEAGDPATLQLLVAGPTNVPGSFTRRELVERYEGQTGRSVSNLLFYRAFGLFKIAVIAQQIYARYVRGFTRDERFAGFIDVIAALGQAAAGEIDGIVGSRQ
jgi:aminoglycoside phosphotransferase (APT) family kinase protein